MSRKQMAVIAALILLLYACSREASEMQKPFTGFIKPAHFPQPVYKFDNNAVTKEGFELGRKLFSEPRLSRDNTITCASCHIQSSAFTQHGHDVSHGIDDRLGKRNSPPIMNLAWVPLLMWDGGIFDLDLQPIAPITAHEEMDETLSNVIGKLQAHAVYPALFKKAFGSEVITTAGLMKALSQFMVMCISDQAKYDSVMRNQASFTAVEQQGYAVFKSRCNSCHTEPLFTDHSFRNNGIGAGANNDFGRYEVTLSETDRYKFKVPSLRNLAYTAPFMHDGRFIRLDAVLDHYRTGVRQTPNLDPSLMQGIPLSIIEKDALLAFLNTLNDRNFVTSKILAEQ